MMREKYSRLPLTEKPTLDAVKAAIKTVLSKESVTNRKAASDFLDSLKYSVFAWEICDQLLSANESIEISYLAAHMLRHKVARNFNELPQECHQSLRESVLTCLQATEDYAVQGQLTIAIADLTLLLNDWSNPIEDLATRLGLSQSLNSVVITDYTTLYKALHSKLIFAYILHQMCDLNHNSSERPSWVFARRREEYEDYLISKVGQVISWWLGTLQEIIELKSHLQASLVDSNNADRTRCLEMIDKLTGQIYLCYSAWLRIFDEQNLNDTLIVIDSAFNHLRDPSCPDSVHKYAVEVIVQTASFCDDSHLDYMMVHLVNQIYTLEAPFRETVNSEDQEKSNNFARLFSFVAESSCAKVVIEERDFRLLELLIGCLNHYDFEFVEETYHFWWIFLETLQCRLKSDEYGPFIPYINRFVMAVTKLCQFDPDEDSVIAYTSDMISFRESSLEIITNVLFITTVENFIRDNQILDNFRSPITSLTWERLEALLLLVSCLTQLMSSDDNHIRMQIFQSIITQQANQTDMQVLLHRKSVPLNIGTSSGEVHPQIVATTLKIIGSLNELLAENPDHLALALNYILTCIHHPRYKSQLQLDASECLTRIMEVNASRHFVGCPEMLSMIKGFCQNLDQLEDGPATMFLKCGMILAEAISDINMKDQFLCEILKPTLDSLKSSIDPNNKSDTTFTRYVTRLSTFFRLNIPPNTILELKNFIILVDTSVWPLLLNVLEVYAPEKSNHIERTCRALRYMIRCVKPEWMIERIAETMINLYKTYPQSSSPLYICSILVDEFANRTPEINLGLFRMLEILCSLTFTLLNMDAPQQKNLLTMKSYPETIDDMMRLFHRFVKKCPGEFLNCSALESIIELSISTVQIDHPEANLSVCKFINSFLATAKDYKHIGDAIRNVIGARLTDAVIKASLLELQSGLIVDEVQILMTLYNFDKDLFNSWVEASVKTLPKVNIQGIETVTEDHLNELIKGLTTVTGLKGMINCLRAFARRYS